MDLLPAVVDAVGSDIEILIDGGVRRGADVIKAVFVRFDKGAYYQSTNIYTIYTIR